MIDAQTALAILEEVAPLLVGYWTQEHGEHLARIIAEETGNTESTLNGFQFTFGLPCPMNRYYRPVTRFKLGRSDEGRIARDEIVEQVAQQNGGRLPKPLLGPVRVSWDQYPNTHPLAKVVDVDGYSKCMLDGLEAARVLEDDAQVAELRIKRHQAQGKGSLEVTVEEI